MRFWQKYSFEEYGFGTATVLFAVSDVYDELFQEIGTETNIFQLESVKFDLNTEEGSFAIDELPFSINQLAAATHENSRAMYFALEAAKIENNRYCAVFMGSLPTLANKLFLGKINPKISGVDKKWNGSEYEYIVNPKREYKFTAYSYDVSELEKAKMTATIRNAEGVKVSNIYERFEAETWTSIKEIFAHRLTFAVDYVSGRERYICGLGNLYKVLTEYLKKAKDIIFELTATSVDFEIVENTLGVHTCPAEYTFESPYGEAITEVEAAQTLRTELKLSSEDSGSGWSSPFIHRKLISPETGSSGSDIEKLNASSDKTFSFQSLDNVSDLLFEVARAFACYLVPTYEAGNKIKLAFRSREGMVEEEYTYIVGATEAGVDTSSILVSGATAFYGVANGFAVDGFDEVANLATSDNLEPSVKFKDASETRKRDEEKKGSKFQRLALTTSPTISTIAALDVRGGHTVIRVPFNIINSDNYWEVKSVGVLYSGRAAYERLHTGIYIITQPPEAEQVERLGTGINVWRPASKIFANVGDKPEDFETLTDYVNRIMERDKQYYETEYNITVPSWNGFSKNEDVAGASWKNLKLGSKIKLAETVERYVNGAWEEHQVVRDYAVVGIEINLSKPETKIRLHNLEKFAYGFWNGDEGLLSLTKYVPLPAEGGVVDSATFAKYEIDDGETIVTGDAVMKTSTWKIIKARANSAYYGETIGVAIESGVGGEKISVQTSGRVSLPGVSFGGGEQVFARTVNEGINISRNALVTPTPTEDMVILVGRIDSDNSFIIDIQEFPFESGVEDA